MNRLLRLAALAALVLPFAARAQLGAQPQTSSLPEGVYLTPRLGLYSPEHKDMDGFNTGFGFEVAAGKRLNPNVAAEVAIGWFSSGTDTMSFYDPSIGQYSGKADFTAIPITATGKLILPLQRADLFAVGGLGLVFTDVGATAHTSYGSGSQSYSDTSLALVLGLGGSYAVTQNVSFDLMARYLVGNADVNGQSAHYDGLLVTTGLVLGF